MSDASPKIARFLAALGFAPADGGFQKRYEDGYEISAAGNAIDYGGGITLEDDTTANFSRPENFVVLECVDRLLEKGYRPKDLTLEKRWPLGRTGKSGKADIVVRSRNSEKTLLIIECKTWGGEYEKEKRRMHADGGQLFSYFQQDKTAGFLALYASRVGENGEPEYANAVVPVYDTPEERRKQAENPDDFLTYEKAKTVRQSLAVWQTKRQKKFLDGGVFEDDREPYSPGFRPLRIGDLAPFSRENKVYSRFMEILRHNNISDRSNAFNRFISLVLAKMMDESSGADAVADFQYKQGIDDAESLYERLNGLYTAAMKHYLKEELVNHTLDSIREIVEYFPRQAAQDDLYRIYRELKLYSNNEFAFKEVYNEKLFHENAKVLEEVVSLLQPYRFRYDEKSRFLGEFFELMLENGYKQTEGQFFTPTPLARFIINSMPLDKVVAAKLRRRGEDRLPRVVDFACGSGHFLTEAIESLQNIMRRPQFCKLPKLKNYIGHTRWARDYIWGVERDYRLARTSQAACFMHGDGDANIVFGDGLEKHPMHGMREGGFDVLAANPPYSIDGFKLHLKVEPRNFELWDDVADTSDDIEVFFIERAGQLLANGGMAGIILPSTILDKPGLYGKAREIIMRRFLVRAVVSLGGRAFAATGTQTVVLFLQKRGVNFAKNCNFIARDFIINNNRRKYDFVDSKALYADYMRRRGLEDDGGKYWDALAAARPELIREYREKFRPAKQNGEEEFVRHVLLQEAEKFRVWLLAHHQTGRGKKRRWLPQKTLIVRNNGGTDSQDNFLGYKFSKRRGSEGLQPLDGGGLLCDDKGEANDPGKVNYYISRTFGGEYPAFSDAVKEHCRTVRLGDLINFDGADFTGGVNINIAGKKEFNSRWEMKPLGSAVSSQYGHTATAADAGNARFLRITDIDTDGLIKNADKKYIDADADVLKKYLLADGDIVVARSGSVGRMAIFKGGEKTVFASYLVRLKADKSALLPEFLYYFSFHPYYWEQVESYTITANQPNLNAEKVKSFKIPLPPPGEQKKIIAACAAVDKKTEAARREIARLRAEINGLANGAPKSKTPRVNLGDCVQFAPKSKRPASEGKEKGKYPFFTSSPVQNKFIDAADHRTRSVIIGDGGKSGVHIADEFSASDHNFVVAAKSGLDIDYLYYWLSANFHVLESGLKGANLQNIAKSYVEAIQLPLPPLAGQRALIAKILPKEEKIAALQRRIESAPAAKAAVLEEFL